MWAKTENRGTFAKNSDNPTACTILFTAPDGSTTEFIRNQYGLLTEVKSTFGKHQHTEQFYYDPRHRLVEAQDSEQRRIQLSYDDKDRFNRLTNARGKQWHYGYNAHHKLTHIARPNQSEEKHHYDRHGNLIRYTDANSVDWQLKYGAFDLLTEKVDGEGNRWLYDYDKDSLKLNKVTNPKGETYTYTFNENGQVQQFYQNSAKNISYSDLIKLVKILQQKGARIRLPRDTPQLSAIQRKLWAIWKAVADESTSAALNTYVKRYYAEVADWRELDSEQAASIVEQLKQWKKRIGR